MEEENDDTTCANNRSISSVESLGDLDWDGLLELCKEKEEQLNLAGACGLKLHEQLMEAQVHIDEMRGHYDMEMEKLSQELYELKHKLECKEKSLLSQEHDFEEYQKKIANKHQQDIEEIQENVRKDLQQMKKEKASTMADFEQMQLREQQAVEKIAALEKKVQELQTENIQRSKHEPQTNNAELIECYEKIALLEEGNEEIDGKVRELQENNQMLTLELSTKTKQCSELSKEMEEVEMRCTTYFNHLQQAREEKTQLKTELDLLKAEQRNYTHKNSGNSLFSEVEDQRIEMEKKLLSMQVKYESLLKAYNFVKTQLHNMKTQVFALLQIKNARADEDHISRLERALKQAKSENAVLTNKLKDTDLQQNLSKDDISTLSKHLPEFKKSKDLVDFLYIQLEEYKTKLEQLQREYDQIYMVKIVESDKLHNAEQQLYESNVQANKYNQANMRLKLKLDETKNKLEAEIQKRKLIEKKFNYDSSTDVVPLGMINDDTKKVEERPLPYTLRKAKEKQEEEERNRLQFNCKKSSNTSKQNISSAVHWHKLPREILDQLGIQLQPEDKSGGKEDKEEMEKNSETQEKQTGNRQTTLKEKVTTIDHQSSIKPMMSHDQFKQSPVSLNAKSMLMEVQSFPKHIEKRIVKSSKCDAKQPYTPKPSNQARQKLQSDDNKNSFNLSESISERSSDSLEKPRRVSFKETPETIPAATVSCNDSVFEKSAQLSSTNINDVIDENDVPRNEKEVKSETPVLKNKGKTKEIKRTIISPLKDTTNINPEESTSVGDTDTLNGECKLQ